MSVERKCFYDWRDVAGEVVDIVSRNRDSVDYVTFVPDGEPTLDACMGRIIEFVKGGDWCQGGCLDQCFLVVDGGCA
ncbi:hypothetical protein [Thermofilum sp.]|uniref:hypothetical protein n=1 Tax=Thermofilum sp. TaxID=1961369 RepID=UPI003169D507